MDRTMPKTLFPEIEDWKERQGAQRGYKGETKQPKSVKVTQPKTTVNMSNVNVTKMQPKGTYEDYITWYNRQSETMKTRQPVSTESEIAKFESLYDKYKVGMIIEKVPQHLKQIVPMDWWKRFRIEDNELDNAISIMEWGLAQGDRNKWTGGMTEIAYAAQYGRITPDEIFLTGISSGKDAPLYIQDILDQKDTRIVPDTDEGWIEAIKNEEFTTAEVKLLREIQGGKIGSIEDIRAFYADKEAQGYSDEEIYANAVSYLKGELDITQKEAEDKVDEFLNEQL